MPVNILSGFKKTGVYPFNPSAVDDRQLTPSTAFQMEKPIPTGTADEALCGSSSEKSDEPPPSSSHQRRKHCSQGAMKNTMISRMMWSIMQTKQRIL